MKKKQVKRYVDKCGKLFKLKFYIIIGIMTIVFTASTIYQQKKYNKLRSEIWDKVEELIIVTPI